MNKQIEEAAKTYANIPLDRDVDTEERYFNDAVREYDAFIDGAEWAADKLYTEQDIRNTFIAGMENIDCNQEEGMFSTITIEEWLNKFKKES
jgi:hypothetical protein